MVRRAYETGRRAKELSNVGIETVVTDWDDGVPPLLVPGEGSRNLASGYPSLLPLSWLCGRLQASNGTAGWAAEFERTTKIAVHYPRSYVDWAIQAFRERVAYRVYAEHSGE